MPRPFFLGFTQFRKGFRAQETIRLMLVTLFWINVQIPALLLVNSCSPTAR